ncbi:MAG: hypothetical protein ACLQVN_03230 [Bryobacteraceae bacterium]
MKTLILVMAACLPALAAEPAPDPATTPAAPHARCADSGKRPARKTRKWHSPLYYLGRAGQAEVNLAIRLSSWGIHDGGTDLPACRLPAPADREDRTGGLSYVTSAAR